jgi:hypothetical protein
MARVFQLLVRDPDGAVWDIDVRSGDTIRAEANNVYRFGVEGKAASFPPGTTVQRVGKDLKIRFVDGEEITLTDWAETPGASLSTRGATLLGADGKPVPEATEVASGAAAEAPPVSSAAETAAPPGTASVQPAPSAPPDAAAGADAPPGSASGTGPDGVAGASPGAAAPVPPPAAVPGSPASVPASGGISTAGILGGVAGLAALAGAAGGGGGGGSSGGAAPPAAAPASAAPTGLGLAAASDSGVVGDLLTNDTTPTISGRAEANAAITIRNSAGTTIATTTADASGTWSATPTAALPQGAAALQVIANRGGGATDSAATAVTVTIDTTAPAVPIARLDASSDSGTTADSRTNDTTPTISGTGTAGDTVRVTQPGGGVLTATVAANGTWSVTPTVALANGAQALSVTAADPAGNVSTATILTVTVDATAPAAPSARLDASSDSGVVGDATTNDATPTISGTGTASDTIRVALPGGAVLTTTVAADGSWRVTPVAPLAAGANALSVTATDAAGNVSATTPLPLTIVTSGPAAPAAQLAASSDSGTLADNLTNDTTPTISGTGTAGHTIRVNLPGGAVLTTTVATNGSWSATPATPLPAGPNLLSVTAEDPVGNVSAVTTLTVTIDATPPAAPTAQLDASSDSGTAGDNRTNDTTPTVSGTGTSGDSIRVTLPGGTVLATTVAADGSWSATPVAPLASGANLLSITATDPAGNASAATVRTVTIDTTAPAAPVAQLAATSDSGTLGDNRTSDTTPTISGTGTAGDTIRVTLPGGEVLTATVAGNGSWSATLAPPLANGANALSVTATDAAANTSTATVLNLTIDTVAPPAPTLAVAEGPVISQGENANGIQAAVTGALVAGDSVSVVLTRPDNSTVTTTRLITAGEATAGTAIVTVPAQAQQGSYTLVARLVDAAGNVGADSAAVPVTLDSQAPGAPVLAIAEAADGFVNDAEAVSGGGTPVVVTLPSGTVAGDVITLTVDGPGGAEATLTYAVAAGDLGGGVATVLIPTGNLSTAGAYSVTATATDGNGNTGPASTDVTFTLDRVAPPAPGVPNMTAGSDTGDSATDEITLDSTPTFTISGSSNGATVQLLDTDGTTVIGTAIGNGGGSWTVTSSALAPGAHTVSARQLDAAGNPSVPSAGLLIVVDTQAPTFATAVATAEGFAPLTLSPTTLAAADDSTAQGSLQVTAASFVSGTGFGAGDLTIQASSGTATVTRGPGTVNQSGSFVIGVTMADLAGNVTTQDVTVTVAAVNDAPSGADATLVTTQDVSLTLGAAAFGFTDPADSPANALQSVRITSLPGAGALQLLGGAVTAGQEIAAADLAAGNLQFVPGTSETGTGYASFNFQVRDDGGTVDGGVDLDPTANVITIDVAALALEPLPLAGEPEPLALALMVDEADATFGLVDDGNGTLVVDRSAPPPAEPDLPTFPASPQSGGESELLAFDPSLSGSSLANLG